MNKKEFSKYQKACESLGWKVYVDRECDSVELSQYSPAGEDFFITMSYKNFYDDIQDYEFDAEDHVYMWLEAKRNKVRSAPDIFTLVQDAKDIDEMIEKLQDKLFEVK